MAVGGFVRHDASFVGAALGEHYRRGCSHARTRRKAEFGVEKLMNLCLNRRWRVGGNLSTGSSGEIHVLLGGDRCPQNGRVRSNQQGYLGFKSYLQSVYRNTSEHIYLAQPGGRMWPSLAIKCRLLFGARGVNPASSAARPACASSQCK